MFLWLSSYVSCCCVPAVEIHVMTRLVLDECGETLKFAIVLYEFLSTVSLCN